MLIERNKDNFDPSVHSPFKHNLVDHPLMKLDSIRELALRHPKVRYHSARISRNQKLDKVVDECPNGMSLEETLENIETSG